MMKKMIIPVLSVMLLFSVSSTLCALPDGAVAGSSRSDRAVLLSSEDELSQNVIATLSGHPDEVISVAFSPDGRMLASGSSDKTIKLWDMESHNEIATLSGHEGTIYAVAFSPDGRILASGSPYGDMIKLWNVENYNEIVTLSGDPGGFNSIAFSSDSAILAIGNWDATIKLWDTVSYNEIATLSGHSRSIQSVDFSSDGRMLASGSYDRLVKLWDVDNHNEIATLYGHSGSVNSVAFSPDGRTLVSGSDDKTIKLWDVERQNEIATLYGHSSDVDTIALSPDGRMLASSGGKDTTIKLWNMENQNEIATLSGHSEHIYSIAFSPDGGILASGSGDHTIKLWNLTAYSAMLNPPVVLDIPDQSIEKGAAFTAIRLDGYVFDQDDEDSELAWTYSGNSALSISISDERVASVFAANPEWTGSETITFTATDPKGTSDSDTAIFQVRAPGTPKLSLSLGFIDLGAEVTGNSFSVNNVGDGILQWEIATGNLPKWLDLFPQSGANTPGESLPVSINVNRKGLDIGGYAFEISVKSNGGSENVLVRMEVEGVSIVKPRPGKWSGKHISFEVSEDGSKIKNFSLYINLGFSRSATYEFPEAAVVGDQFFYDIQRGKFTSSNSASGWWDGYIRTYSGSGGLVTVTATHSSGIWTAIYSGSLSISDIPDQAVTAGATFVNINLENYVTDPQHSDANIAWEYSGNKQLKVDIGEDRIVTVKAPNSEWSGSETITFTATNPDGISESDDATFSVIPQSLPPIVWDIPDQIIGIGEAFASINLDDYISDPDNRDDEITWVCEGHNRLKVDISDDRIANVTQVDGGWTGSEIITFVASDPGGSGWSETAMFTVLPSVMSPLWDVNKDSIVNVSDLVLVAQHIEEKVTTPLDPNPDVNRDGKVDIADLILVGQHFGESYLQSAPSKSIWDVDIQYLPVLIEIYEIMESKPSSDPSFAATKNILYMLISSLEVPNTELLQNYPNPFNPETWIPFHLKGEASVSIRIFNLSGQLVKTLDMGHKDAGIYVSRTKAAYWDGKNEAGEEMASGIYFYTIQAGDFTATKKMIVRR